MHPLLDICLFVFVSALTFIIFYTQIGVAAYTCAGVLWFLYILSYVDDDAGTS